MPRIHFQQFSNRITSANKKISQKKPFPLSAGSKDLAKYGKKKCSANVNPMSFMHVVFRVGVKLG